MTHGFRRFGLILTGAIACWAQAAVAAQPPITRPDFSGSYYGREAGDPPLVISSYELTPEGEAAYAKNKAGIAAADPAIDTALRCLPTGVTRAMGPLPMYFSHTPVALVIITEADPLPRLIRIGGEHRQDYWPTYMGDSIAQWEGDTLVIESVNFVPHTFVDMAGLPHSDQMRIVERMRLHADGKTLDDTITIEDPKYYKAPFTFVRRFHRSDVMPVENVCENARERP